MSQDLVDGRESVQGDLASCEDGQRLKHPQGKEKTCKLQFRQWKEGTPALASLLPSIPSSVFTAADETSFLELPSSDQRAATLPFLVALAGTLPVQDHFAVPGSQAQKILGEGRHLRRVDNPTSCSESFVLHLTGYPWPLQASEGRFGKTWLCLSHSFPVAPTSSWAQGHGQQPCTCSGRLSISLDLQT